MARSIPNKNPFKMHTVSRRDRLEGEAARWYDRAAWLRGRTLNIPAGERTAFQHGLDEIWRAVEHLDQGGAGQVDAARLERVYRSLFIRWPEVLGTEPPAELG